MKIRKEIKEKKLDDCWQSKGDQKGPRPSAEIGQLLTPQKYINSGDLSRIYAAYVRIRALGERLRLVYDELAFDPLKRPKVDISQRFDIRRGEIRIWGKFYQTDKQKMEQVFGSLAEVTDVAYVITREIYYCIQYLHENHAREVAELLFQTEQRMATDALWQIRRAGGRQRH